MKQTVTFEMEFLYEGQRGWMYVSTDAKSVEECKDKAEKHFQKKLTELGWKRKATIVEIRKQRNAATDPLRTVIVDDPAPTRKSRKRPNVARSGTKGAKGKNTTTRTRSTNSKKRKKDS